MKICFVRNLSLVFVKRDYEILKKHFDVELIKIPKTKIEWLKYPFTIANQVKQIDAVFCWFAGWHSAIPVHFAKKYKKKSIVVAGGYDVVNLPEINYGAFTNLKEKISSKYVLTNVDIVISVSKSNQKELLEKIQPKKNVLIYNGVPVEDFNYLNNKKEKLVITVGGVKWSNLKRKGIETFVMAARYLPDVPFVVIGKFIDDSIDYLKSIAPNNVEFTDFVTDDELLEWYGKAKVYVQASAHEGFGITVAEAMLCECIPIVTDRFALPEVVGDTGLIVPYNNPKKISDAIKKAMNNSDEFGKNGRERIMKKFPLKNREKELINTIKG